MYRSKWMRSQFAQWKRRVNKPDEDSPNYPLYQEAEKQQWLRLRSEECEDARARAYFKAVQDAEAALIRQRVRDGDFTDMPELEEIQKKLRNRAGNGGALHAHYFVTVNVKSDVTISELQCKVQKYITRCMVKDVEYVYEQRGATELEAGKGLHCHMLVTQRGDVHDGQFKQNTRNTFKTLVGNPATHVDIRPVKPAYLGDKREYMRGLKTGDGKAEKVEIDVIWRRENNLEDYYIHANGDQAQETEQQYSEEAEEDQDE